MWKKGKDVKKWILRVKTYAQARWNETKMAATAPIGLPVDKVKFLLTVSEGDPIDEAKIKTQSSGAPDRPGVL